MPERIYLIDGSAIVYRSHFAFQRNPRLTSDGTNVSAVFGFAQTLFPILTQRGGQFAAVAFDTAAPTFRHLRYPAYKANRPSMPQDLVEQLPLIRALVEAAGVRILQQEGVEADDLIASLALRAVALGHEAVIVSSDKDFNQIVRPRLWQLVPSRGREAESWLGPDEVAARWGVTPEQVLDLFALVGDSVDNVPGVPGIGEKTAAELIKRHGTLDRLYEELETVPRAPVREKLAAHREEALLSRELIRLKTDLLPEAEIETYRTPSVRGRAPLLDLLRRLEFRRLIDSLDLEPERGWSASYETIEDEAHLERILAAFPGAGVPFAIDTETDSLDARRARPVGLSFAWRAGRAYYVPLGHEEGGNVPEAAVRLHLGKILADERVEKVGQNLKFDLHVLQSLGLQPKGPYFDTMLASYLLDPDRPRDLDTLSAELLGHRKIATETLIGKGRQQTTMNLLAVSRVRDYAAEDADVAWRLRDPLLVRLREKGQEALLREIEGPLIPILVEMERTGVHVDASLLGAMGRELEADLARQGDEVVRLAGVSFNLNSPSQLGEVLYERLKLPHGRKTKTGYSTDSEVLEELAIEHPIARAVLDYRQTMKLKTTYLDALPRLVDPRTGRIHAQFNQTVTATGRLSSSDPNLQNIPVRTPQGRRIRRAFVPQRDGDVLISADYSQIELRILAHLSKDPALIAAFRSGEDIHRATAARIFDTDLDRVDPAMRARAKTVNFGVLYGMGPLRLSRELGIPLADAKGFIEHYFAKMPGVKAYLDENLARARKEGFVSTILGRRRYLPALGTDSARARAQAERIAANTPIQGSAADLMKRAMIRVHESLASRSCAAKMILQVHDELLLEGPEGEAEGVESILRDAMEGAIALDVPLEVEIAHGRSWEEVHA